MRIEVVSDLSQFKALEQKWDELLAKSPSDSVYLTWTWLSTWWEVFGGQDRQLHIVLFYDEKDLVGIIPFVITQKTQGFKRKVLEFLGTGEPEADEVCSNYLGAITIKNSKEIWQECWPHIAEGFKQKKWDEVSLRLMRFEEIDVNYQFSNCHVAIEQTTPCAVINLPNSWDEYMSSLSKKWRDQIKRGQKELSAKGKVDYQNITDPEKLKEAFKEFIVLHRLKWGLFNSEKFNLFQHLSLDRLAKQGAASIDQLRCDNRLVATSYKIKYKNTVYFYLPAYDPNFEMKIGLGLIERSFDLTHEIGLGSRVYDFYRAAPGSYKWHMAKDQRSVGKIEIYRKTTTFYLLGLLKGVKRVARKILSLCPGKQK